MADNLAGAFVVASGDSARALEAELRMFEEAIDVLAGSMLPKYRRIFAFQRMLRKPAENIARTA